jgi:hypothetical protein
MYIEAKPLDIEEADKKVGFLFKTSLAICTR